MLYLQTPAQALFQDIFTGCTAGRKGFIKFHAEDAVRKSLPSHARRSRRARMAGHNQAFHRLAGSRAKCERSNRRSSNTLAQRSFSWGREAWGDHRRRGSPSPLAKWPSTICLLRAADQAEGACLCHDAGRSLRSKRRCRPETTRRRCYRLSFPRAANCPP